MDPVREPGYVVPLGNPLWRLQLRGHSCFPRRFSLKPRANVGGRLLRRIEQGENDNYRWQRAIVEATRNGQPLAPLAPEGRLYKSDRSQLHEVDIHWRLNEDFYLNFAGMNDDRAVIQAYVFPLISWIWNASMSRPIFCISSDAASLIC